MKQVARNIIVGCSFIIILIILFPPLVLTNGFRDGHGFLFELDPQHSIDVTTLIVRIAAICFVGLFLVLVCSSLKLRNSAAYIFVRDYWHGEKNPTFSLWSVFAPIIICANAYYLHLDEIANFLNLEFLPVHLGFLVFIPSVIWASVGVCRSETKHQTQVQSRRTNIWVIVILALLFSLSLIIPKSVSYIEAANKPASFKDIIVEFNKKYPPKVER